MIKYCILIMLFSINLYGASYAQLKEEQLSETVALTIRELIDIRLQILAAQLTSGSYMTDMGRLGFPVSISFDRAYKIRFNIDGSESKFDSTLTRDLRKEVIKESMEIVSIGIIDLFSYKFPKVDFNPEKDLVGFWYSSHVPKPNAKWENEKFTWLE